MNFSVRFANLFFLVMFLVSFLARYNERVVWTDKQLNLKLLRKGVLTRIYTPMVGNNAAV
jgi:hypothetical protein